MDRPTRSRASQTALRTKAAIRSALSETPQERGSPVPGGGTVVEVPGRFHSGVVATLGADGTLFIQHRVTTQLVKDGE